MPNKTRLILRRYINQQTLMKELHIGYDALKMLCLNGLEVTMIGWQYLYDFEAVKKVSINLKIISLIKPSIINTKNKIS